ncbi:hypothetical protein M4R23_08915 [Acidovorax sp. GBBC 3332]|nr:MULTISPECIES: hypothetical protein [unclassified Acidovorax]MDA8449803.1 hypothetical protein [Acidovorax sp. GBBC 3297]MDA8459248.1 hypothetical protein [Acidovorax sp. GBBC 3333]MDA8464285.1 hypothetical protein [Acidovorax sp. GBBC 3332]MDA8469505.1 hypothetical protein [Acidovorax sp. GBBC 3299]
MTRVLNAFESVRPRGATVTPTTVPAQRRPGRAPPVLAGSTPRDRDVVLDRNGRACVPLAPRCNGAFSIESGAVAQASVSKRRAIVRGGI